MAFERFIGGNRGSGMVSLYPHACIGANDVLLLNKKLEREANLKQRKYFVELWFDRKRYRIAIQLYDKPSKERYTLTCSQKHLRAVYVGNFLKHYGIDYKQYSKRRLNAYYNKNMKAIIVELRKEASTV